MKRLGITGGIGSGKSTVCQHLAQRGIPIYNSDARAKALMSTTLTHQIESLFGSDAYVNGSLNRKLIASVVFNSPDKLTQLNAIVHPAVGEDFEQWAEGFVGKVPFVALESAILFESGFDSRVDAVLLIDAPLEVRIERTIRRDNSNRADVEKRISQQQTETARNKANFVINNDHDGDITNAVDDFLVQLNQLWK